jgi:hypothetical protein
LNGSLLFGNRHRECKPKILPRSERNAIDNTISESGPLRPNAIPAGFHILQGVVTTGIRTRHLIGVFVNAVQRNLSAGDGCAGSILNRASNAPKCRLRLHGKRT